ncbi:unnamed protein product [Soboliphyme baturini]|uniref:Transposase n=1 Tax=Soboliphyme baturini TaxID=241478 RepID=A0A183ISP7_9BILA|nr:unnamed protein product [Soboliphyme baturini]
MAFAEANSAPPLRDVVTRYSSAFDTPVHRMSELPGDRDESWPLPVSVDRRFIRHKSIGRSPDAEGARTSVRPVMAEGLKSVCRIGANGQLPQEVAGMQ